MTDIETIALYGPGNLKPEDLVAGFVAREKTLAYFLNELRHQATPGASPRHHLIIGQRGMGKTTLLLRIAVAIGETQELTDKTVAITPTPNGNAVEINDKSPSPSGESEARGAKPVGVRGVESVDTLLFDRPHPNPPLWGEGILAPDSSPLPLADYFVPLTFREEQYNVINLHVFWRNCIESLLDWLEQQGRNDEAKILEQQLNEVENAYEQDRKAEVGGNAAGRVFRQACQRLQRRPVLFLDNLDLIIDALKKHDWGLRDSLQQSDGPLVIGAASAYPKSLSDRKTAFFDFFRITTLERLETVEVRACLQRLAHRRGEAGVKVAAVLRRDPGRIDALTEMTGGNPRTLALLYLLLESQAGEDAFADLEKLLDRMTPLYKARTEEAAPQARAVLDAVALNWNPITAKQVARDSGLDVTAVNAQLTRLENDGYVEKVEVSGSGRSGYQIVERFFNIWYLMRHGNRRLRDRVRLLTILLRGIFSTNDRETMARDVLLSGKHKGRGDFMLALSESVDDPIYRKALSYIAVQDLVQQCDIRERIARLVDFRNIVPEQVDMLELEEQALAVKREWPEGVDVKIFWNFLGGSLLITKGEKRKIIEQLPTMEIDRLNELLESFRNDIERTCKKLEINISQLTPFLAEIRNGGIADVYDMAGASAAALRENNPFIAAIGCLYALKNQYGDREELRNIYLRYKNEDDIWKRIEKVQESQNFNSFKWMFNDGLRLWRIKDFEQAEIFFRNSIYLTNSDAEKSRVWYVMGNLLTDAGTNYERAEQAYREAIAINYKNANSWFRLGSLLKNKLMRYEEAETAYRQAIELQPNNASWWSSLGLLLQECLEKYKEAELAYRQAIAIDPKIAYLWHNLGHLLQIQSDRYEEAEDAYRQAITHDPKFAGSWHNLGFLLQHQLNRYEEAETAYRQAIALDPKLALPWCGLGNLFQNRTSYEEAETAYHQAIELEPKLAEPWSKLGNLLQSHLARYEEAEAAYRQAIELDPKDADTWNGLGNLLQDYLGRYEEAEAAHFHTLELDPENTIPHANLAYLYWLHLNRPEDAQRHAEIAKPGMAECGQRLLDAMQALASDDLGVAWAAFDSALATDDKELWVDYIDDLQRVIRYAVSRGYGLKFKEWMEAAGYPDRYAPLYWAFLALLEGEAILLNVNPEVRRTAERIYRGLVIGQKPEPVKKKGGRVRAST